MDTPHLCLLLSPATTADRYQFVHNISFLVPPFDPDYINWPSYVEKLNRHYDAQVRPISLHMRAARRLCFLSLTLIT